MHECRSDLCRQGRGICPTPQACLLPDDSDEFLPTTRRGWVKFALVALVAIACLAAILAPLGLHQ